MKKQCDDLTTEMSNVTLATVVSLASSPSPSPTQLVKPTLSLFMILSYVSEVAGFVALACLLFSFKLSALWLQLKNKQGFIQLPIFLEAEERVDIEMSAVEMWEEEIAPDHRRDHRNNSTLPREMEEESGATNDTDWDEDEETTTCVI